MHQSQADFEHIVMPHAGKLLRFAERLTGNRSEAEDLAQESLLLAWRSFRQFREDSNAAAWVFRILMNAFLGRQRKPRPLALEAIPVFQAGPSIHRQLEVTQAFDALPADSRTVLLLAIMEGFTCREIADILSIPIGTVMSRLSRARQLLRAKLAHEFQTANHLS